MNGNIQGWMGEQELQWLYERAKEMNSIVELGSWKGKSTEALLLGCKGTVYAVDHFRGDSMSFLQQSMVKTEDIYKIFMENVGHFPNLRVFKMDSAEASKIIDPVDMVFVDTEHTYKQVTKEIDVWLPKAKKLICGHDWQPAYLYQGLRQGVREKLGEVQSFRTIWFKEIQ